MTPKTPESMMAALGKERLLAALRKMLLIRNFEVRAESAYQQGKVGGFFHAYIGQEALQTAIIEALGVEKHWWTTSYRCHALALLLGATPFELFAELLGRACGNAKGRGGSMHFFTDRMLGGHGIVGGQIPIATGAAFTLKYTGARDAVSVCFFGDGATAQGSFHESLNLASLWNLPCIYVIENNKWGMGTAVKRALAVQRLAEEKAPGYNMEGYTLDGMDFLSLYDAFSSIGKKVMETQRPVLVEVITERFRGHSISDPGLYRTKEELKCAMERGPITLLKNAMQAAGLITEEEYKTIEHTIKEQMIDAMKLADAQEWPNLSELEEGVYAS